MASEKKALGPKVCAEQSALLRPLKIDTCVLPEILDALSANLDSCSNDNILSDIFEYGSNGFPPRVGPPRPIKNIVSFLLEPQNRKPGPDLLGCLTDETHLIMADFNRKRLQKWLRTLLDKNEKINTEYQTLLKKQTDQENEIRLLMDTEFKFNRKSNGK